MQVPDPEHLIFVAVVGLSTLIFAVIDCKSHRIPNVLTVPIFCLGLGYQSFAHGVPGLLDGLTGFATGFGILFVLWMIGGGGGGDVKLMGALGAWLGFERTLLALLLSALFVVLSTIVLNVLRHFGIRIPKQKRSGKRPSQHELASSPKIARSGLPYALPVAMATWTIMIVETLSVVFRTTTG